MLAGRRRVRRLLQALVGRCGRGSVDAPAGLDIRRRDLPEDLAQTLRCTDAGGIWVRRHAALSKGCGRAAHLLAGNAEGEPYAPRSTAALPVQRLSLAGRGYPPQPRADANASRPRSGRLAAGD